MKRIFALLLAGVMLFALAACGETGTETSQGTETAPTDTAGKTSSDTQTVQGFNPDLEHMFLACDITNHGVVVFDLNACDGDYELLKNDVSVVWEWRYESDPNATLNGPGLGIDSAKYRYSPYYDKDVIIACSSNGWVGVIDYEACSLIWEYKMQSGPHSVEMLPNGDLMVAVSNDPGALAYIPLSAGATQPVHSIPSLYCHGVSWDPELELLWVLEDTGVYAAEVVNMGTMDGQVVRLDNGDRFANNEAAGHAFSPVYGKPGKYWASSGRYLWQFDTETETLTRQFEYTKDLTPNANIKGIASFSDGTVVEAFVNIGGNATQAWSSDGLRVITMQASSGKVAQLKPIAVDVIFDTADREFYKLQPFTKNYQ